MQPDIFGPLLRLQTLHAPVLHLISGCCSQGCFFQCALEAADMADGGLECVLP